MNKPKYVNCKNCYHSEFDTLERKYFCWGFGRYMEWNEVEKGCENFK